MTVDKNGRTIQCGDIVKIENAFFKNDNGYWFVEQDGTNPAYSSTGLTMYKIGKRGKISRAKYNIAFWPLAAFCSDRVKNAMAREHNSQHATIEIVNDVDNTEVINYIKKKVAEYSECIKDYERRLFNDEFIKPAKNAKRYFMQALERLEG